MQLSAKHVLTERDAQLQATRQKIEKTPGLALIWVGDDPQTKFFISAKQRKAQLLKCQFFLHHFTSGSDRQLQALIAGLNNRADIDGIVLQLPLPKGIETDALIDNIVLEKDIDGLKPGSQFPAPTPSGIITLLEANVIDPAKHKTIIIGAGRLVGMPLSKMFRERGWPMTHLTHHAEKAVEQIRQHDLVISCTGVQNLITPPMVGPESIVIDGSGVDVNVEQIEPFVKALTPKKGAIGPLTVSYLFENLLTASAQG